LSGKPGRSRARAEKKHASERERGNAGKKWPRSRFRPVVRESALGFSSPDIDGVANLHFPVSVRDGIGTLSPREDDRETPPLDYVYRAVNDICLLQRSAVGEFKLPETGNTRVSRARVELTSRCRWARTEIGPVRVRFAASVRFRAPLIGGDGGVFPERFPVHSSIGKIETMPIRRRGIDSGKLPESVARACLTAAGKQKGLPLDRCRLIALFRHIPVEMVSRLHFFGERGEIEYTLFPSAKRSQARVYDLIAVRDLSSDEVHLIPYATQNRTVRLS
jgi:hypothetical protein